MSVAYLDTHIAVFLHDGLVDELSVEARRQIESNDLLISPMVYFELEYLFQRKKIGVEPAALFHALSTDFGVALCQVPFARVVNAALSVGWTSDPFDRLIVGQAKANRDAWLVTRDKEIRRHYYRAAW